MAKNFVKFINHASIMISNSNKSILTDPWYSGSVFDDGWNLLYENSHEKIQELLENVNFIWISHEHPDHFSIKFLNDFEKILKEKNIQFIFQKTKDQRVISYLKLKKFNFIELDNNKLFNIDKNFSLKIQRCDFYDSALIININDKKIFNLNDCPLKTKSEIKSFKKDYGKCDFLFTQFSYAAWKGGKDNLNWRKSAAEEKIRIIKNQSNILGSKFTIPFASFIRFSDHYNNYLNDSVNTPKIILDKCKDINSKILFLEPYEVLNLDDPKQEMQSCEFWNKIYDDKINFQVTNKNKVYDFNILKDSFNTYVNRIFANNSKTLILLLSKLKALQFFQPIIIDLKDSNFIIKVDIANNIFEKVEEEPDIEMNSKSLFLIFKQDFGYDTLTVNGCFEERKKNGFTKMSKSFAIGNLNNLGIKINFKIIFDFSVISLFLKKLFYIKKRLV
jgi:UDP-MurNAc hydroxylase